jgi:DNA-binding SARP family transcriptional activator
VGIGWALPRADRPITLLAARGGAIGSEELAQALHDARRLGDCVWLRLVAPDRHIGVLAHDIAHAAERAFPGTGGLLVNELRRRSDGSVEPEELARALASLLPGEAVVVLEDGFGVVNTRSFTDFARAWSTWIPPPAPVVLVAYGRPGRRLRALAPLASWARGRDADFDRLPAAPHNDSALPSHLFDRLVRVAAGRSALVNDVTDAATGERCDLVAEVVAAVRTPRDLVGRLTERLLGRAGPDELDALDAAAQLSFWHPDLGSLAATVGLRPWLIPLQHDWHWLRPFWAESLAGGLRRVLRRAPRSCHFGLCRWPRATVLDSDRSRLRTPPVGRRPTVSVRMLGMFELAIDGHPVTRWHGHLGPAVLRYLLAQPKRACPRDVLLDVFWPAVSPQLARNRLQVVVSSVRRTLEGVADVPLIEFHDGAYCVGRSVDIELDIDAFERLVESGRRDEVSGHAQRAVDRFRAAVAAYRGDFLADSPYEEWTTLTRETLRIKYLDLLDRLARLLVEQGREAECIEVVQRILNQDACREDAHRLLMRCYARQGRTHQALRQFELCCRSLRTTVGVGPSQTTVDLYRSLRGVTVSGTADSA